MIGAVRLCMCAYKSCGNVAFSTWLQIIMEASFSFESVIRGYHVYKDSYLGERHDAIGV